MSSRRAPSARSPRIARRAIGASPLYHSTASSPAGMLNGLDESVAASHAASATSDACVTVVSFCQCAKTCCAGTNLASRRSRHALAIARRAHSVPRSHVMSVFRRRSMGKPSGHRREGKPWSLDKRAVRIRIVGVASATRVASPLRRPHTPDNARLRTRSASMFSQHSRRAMQDRSPSMPGPPQIQWASRL